MPKQQQIKDLERLYKKQRNRRAFRKLQRWGLRLSFVLAVVLIVLYALIRSEKVQNRVITIAKEQLEERLQTRVEIDRFRLAPFDQLIFKDFYVENLRGDTLIYAKTLKANINTNLINIFQKRVIVEDITLEDANIRLRRDSAMFEHDIELMLANVANPKAKPKKEKASTGVQPFEIELDNLFLNRIRFFKQDVMRGEEMDVFLQEASIEVDKLDLVNKHIAIQSVDISGIRMDLVQYERDEDYFNYWYNYVPPADTSTIVEEAVVENDTIRKSMMFTVEEGYLCDGIFYFDDIRNEPIKDTPDNVLDYQHLKIIDIAGAAKGFKFENREFTGQLKKLSFKEESGFVLNELAVDSAIVSPVRVELYKTSLTTPESVIGDTLKFKYKTYEDFMAFKDEVRMDIRFHESVVALKDVITFVPALKDIIFFKENEDELLHLNGKFTGKINKLNGRNLNIRVGNNTIMKGSFRSRNLAVRQEESLNLNLTQFQSTVPSLKELIPNLNLPDNFNKLGTINFSGRFDGFFVDFVAYGDLETALGQARMDMQMKFNSSRTDARYSGKLALTDFDLATWSGDPKFGRVTFRSELDDAVGLTLESIDAKLNATVEKFPFQGYTYRNFTMDGTFRQNFFDGIFNIKDDNIDLGFRGAINFENAVPVYDFDAHVNKLDLKKLQLSKQNFVFSGDFDLNLQGNNLSDMEGEAAIGHLALVQNDSNYYQIDTISVLSTIDEWGDKQFEIKSDVLDLMVAGVFDIQKVPNVFKDYFINKYPRYANKFDLKKSNTELEHNHFNYNLNIKNSKNLTQLLDTKLDTLKGLVFTGFLDNYQDSLSFDLDLKQFQYGDFEFNDVILFGEANKEMSIYDVGVFETIHKKKTELAAVNLLMNMKQDTIEFGFASEELAQGIHKVNINGQFFITPNDLFQISFLPSNLQVNDAEWDMAPDNYIRFGNNTVFTKNFKLTSGEKIISLESLGQRGLALEIENYNLGIVNDYWAYQRLQFKSDLSVRASVADVFNMKDIKAEVLSDTLKVNGNYWGNLAIHASMPNTKEEVTIDLSILNGDRTLKAKGFYVPPKSIAYRKQKVLAPNYFSIDGEIRAYPLNILEEIIPTGVSEVEGTFNAEVQLFGVPASPNIGGELRIADGVVKVDYLGTKYYIDDQKAALTNYLFDGTGAILRDRFGNTAKVYGGIAHTRMKDLRLAARLETERFLALETKKEDNPIFYGTAIGSGIIDFSGPFYAANIAATATALEGTQIIIPISYDEDGSEANFIKFIDRNAAVDKEEDKSYELRGVDLDLDITMTKMAETQLVFDERAGDILKGFGTGDIQIEVRRTGEFLMYGNYFVDRGEYLFTYKIPNFDVPIVNKPFSVKRGGTIRWFGDPFTAQIDLDAEYNALSASPYNLISDFVEAFPDDNLKSLARQKTPVDLELNLKGDLTQPNITFDIDFPQLQGRIGTYTSNKMRLLRQDQLELNRQVFGLIVLGDFLPTGEGALAGQTGNILNKTVSQVISTQLSIYLTDFIRESLADGSVLTGIDFDVNYNEYQYDNIDDINKGKEISLNPKFFLLDDRLTVDIGVGIGLQDDIAGATSRLNSGDIVFEFAISEDRRLKIRAYNRYEQTIAGQLNKTGVGLSYRREFDTFKEFFSSWKKKKKKKK